MRWRIERDYQELKQEFGLSHYEGRGWRGAGFIIMQHSLSRRMDSWLLNGSSIRPLRKRRASQKPALPEGKVRQRFVEEGLEAALKDKPRPGQQRKLSGKQEAHLTAVACTDPPEGRARWSTTYLTFAIV